MLFSPVGRRSLISYHRRCIRRPPRPLRGGRCRGRWGYRMGDGQLYDIVLRDGLNDAFSDEASGWHTEDLVKTYQRSQGDLPPSQCHSRARDQTKSTFSMPPATAACRWSRKRD
jgi:hypothetical protein